MFSQLFSQSFILLFLGVRNWKHRVPRQKDGLTMNAAGPQSHSSGAPGKWVKMLGLRPPPRPTKPEAGLGEGALQVVGSRLRFQSLRFTARSRG